MFRFSLCGSVLSYHDVWYYVEIFIVCNEGTDALSEVTDIDAYTTGRSYFTIVL